MEWFIKGIIISPVYPGSTNPGEFIEVILCLDASPDLGRINPANECGNSIQMPVSIRVTVFGNNSYEFKEYKSYPISNSCCFLGNLASLLRSTILISIFFFNANLSMMNIRDYIFINKAKRSNKIKILEILGFESNTFVSHSPETIKNLYESKDNENISNEADKYLNETVIDIDSNANNFIDSYENIENTSTKTFEPIKITSQLKKIWIDIESRRKWLVPFLFVISTIFLITSAVTIFVNNRNNEIEISNLYATLTLDANNLINEIDEIIEISTDDFYSKYDVSNASAKLQLIESTVMEYERNLSNRNDIENIELLNQNLNIIFNLINDLDDLITYRILSSEILIYNNLLNIDENTNIEIISNKLSEISGTSKLNFNNLPQIQEFEKHSLLLDVTLESAEDLHGRLIASLRNNENEVAKSLIVAIKMNKDIEISELNKSLSKFYENKIIILSNITKLP